MENSEGKITFPEEILVRPTDRMDNKFVLVDETVYVLPDDEIAVYRLVRTGKVHIEVK